MGIKCDPDTPGKRNVSGSCRKSNHSRSALTLSVLFSAAKLFSFCSAVFDSVTQCVVSRVVNKVSEGYTAYIFRAECKDSGSMFLQNAGAHRRFKNFRNSESQNLNFLSFHNLVSHALLKIKTNLITFKDSARTAQ